MRLCRGQRKWNAVYARPLREFVRQQISSRQPPLLFLLLTTQLHTLPFRSTTTVVCLRRLVVSLL
jgi:hypothetical protein